MAVKKLNAKIKAIKNLSPTVKHLVFDLGEEFDFKAGQFVNLSFEIDGETFRRPYSIASNSNKNDELELCIKLVEGGAVTPKIFELVVGDEVSLMGGLGLFTLDKADKEKLVFIGTGTGVAPLRSMILDLIKNEVEKEITLIFGCRSEDEILYKDEFELLEKENPNFKYLQIVSRAGDAWEGRRGHVQDNFDGVDSQNSNFFICGLPAMYDGVKDELLKMGVVKENIFHEVFR